MKTARFAVNDRVNNKIFGNGTVLEVIQEPSKTYYSVLFDDGSRLRIPELTLKPVAGAAPKSAGKTQIGPESRVFHAIFGYGTVKNLTDSGKNSPFAAVQFDSGERKDIALSFLKPAAQNVEANKPGHGVRVYPSGYGNMESFSKEEREVIRYFLRTFSEGSLYMGIHPCRNAVKKDEDGRNAARFGLYIDEKYGAVVFQLMPGAVEAVLQGAAGFEIYRGMFEKQLYAHLLNAKPLICQAGQEKILKFPFRFILLFQEAKLTEAGAAHKDGTVSRELPAGIFGSDFSKAGNRNPAPLTEKDHANRLFSPVTLHCDKGFERLKAEEECYILERLAPEYTTVRDEKISTPVRAGVKNLPDEAAAITGREHEFRAFSLDDEQVNFVNDIRKGHQLILANAGAGKSVLLLSKAFRLADVYPEGRVLITCYNNNLAETYSFRAGLGGFAGKRNLFISTFHAFVLKLLREECKINCSMELTDERRFEGAVAELKRQIQSGRVKTRFTGIFIDEVQIFDPAWLEICHLLLEEPRSGAYFTIAGDLSQDVRNECKRGKAVWQVAKFPEPLEFRGRTRHIKRNYRNSKQISLFLNRILKRMVDRFYDIGLVDNSLEYVIPGETNQDGAEPVIRCGIDRRNITSQIVECLTDLRDNKGVAEEDIAIIFPYKKLRWGDYHTLHWIKEALDEAGVHYSIICPDENGADRSHVVGHTGVVLTTVDSSLGLDFRAVIVAGLYAMDYVAVKENDKVRYQYVGGWEELRNKSGVFHEHFKKEACKLYTACSRAREYLYVLCDARQGSPVDNLLKADYHLVG